MLFIVQRGHFTMYSDLNVIALSKANLRDQRHDSQSISLGKGNKAVIRDAVALEYKNFSFRPK